MKTPIKLISLILMCAFFACSNPNMQEENQDFDKDIPTPEEFNASYGVWNSDGTKIAFQHDVPMGENPDVNKLDQLWIYDIETDQRWKVIEGRVLRIDWNSNDEWFLFNTRLGTSESGYIFKVKNDGTEITKLTGDGTPNKLAYTVAGKWSPDDSRILFSIVAGEPRGISTMNPDGTNADIKIPYGVAGSWFPDGKRVVYVNWDTTVKENDRQRQLYTATKDCTEIKKLTDLPDSDHVSEPDVSPNGNKIVFMHRGRDRSTELFLMNTDGTNITQLTEGKGIVRRPKWHPDGTKILFTRIIPNVSERLYLLDVENREVMPVFPAE